MELNISNIIENEDKKNPYTDEEIASRLGILRENVTEYRKQNGIPDSRLRRKESILKDAFEILNENPDMSDRGFTQELVQRGYKIARYAALTVKKEAEEELYKSGGQVKCKHFLMDKQTMENAKSPNQKGNNEDNKEDINEDAFRNIIGYDGSLKIQVNQAKAAVLYPPKGLHTLLLGPSGVGKSYIAEAMYNFARTTENFSHDAPFMIFNCADYADNPQLLLSQLFGYSKGAFTGASEDKKGIVEMTNGGILFLDEIHRLPPEGQEILFYLLDKGKFRRLGETEAMRESQVMVIAATTENPDSSLLLTFRRRIPMVIQIPSLKERSHLERFSTIKSFFLQESIRLGKDIMVMRDVIKAFMTYECPGNIGQLRSDIQVACARGFLSTTLSNEQIVKVKFNDIPSHVKEGAVNFNYNDEELEKYTSDDIRVSSKGVEVMYRNDDRYVFSSSIYQFIEDKYSELKNSGYDDSDINKKLGEQLEREIMRVASTIKIKPQASREELGDIVGEDILQVAEEIVSEAQKYIKGLLPSVFYPLAIHLSSTYERLMKRKEIINPKLDNLKEKYKKEYEVAKKMARIITKRLHISLPEDEIGFIAMYLKNFQEDKHSREGLVSVLVLSHGRVATGMAEVANKLLGVNHAVGLEMALSDSPNIMLEKAINTIKSINQGKGCIILADMGSLTTFGDIITSRTGIPTRSIGRVDTLMVLECVRRALLPESTLDSIADAVDEDKKYLGGVRGIKQDMSKAIITLCITGEGAAAKVKEYIEDSLKDMLKDIEIIPLGFMNGEDITSSLERLSKSKEILSIVGTINPKYGDIPFISLESLIEGRGLLKLKKVIRSEEGFKNNLPEVINQELIYSEANFKYKDEVLDMMVEKLVADGYVKEEFLLSVYKREALGATFLKGGIAIPHGETKYVTKPAISFAKLAQPINWDGVNSVDLIFLIALGEDSSNYFEQLYKIISAGDALDRLRNTSTKEEIESILFANTLSAK